MEYKFNPLKNNISSLILMLFVLAFNCVVWFIIKNYIYFGLFTIISVLVLFMYFSTVYIIDNNYFYINFNIFKIKIKYNKILNVKKEGKKVRLMLKNITLDLYPEKETAFLKELKQKIKENK